MTPYVAAVRKLLDGLHAQSASGLITREIMTEVGRVEQLTRALEQQPDEQADTGSGERPESL